MLYISIYVYIDSYIIYIELGIVYIEILVFPDVRSVVHQVLRGGFLLIDFKYIQVQVPGSTCMSLVRNEDGSVS